MSNPLFLGFLLLMMGMLFFMQRQQKKQQQQRTEALDALAKGDEIVTIGGLHGLVDAVDKEKKTVDIDCEGVILTFDRQAIRTFNKPSAEVVSEEVIESAVTEEVEKIDNPIEEAE